MSEKDSMLNKRRKDALKLIEEWIKAEEKRENESKDTDQENGENIEHPTKKE